MIHDEKFWSERYQNGLIPWDTGAITTPLQTYFDQVKDKDLKILIPGGGNSYEAEYLWKNGFNNVFVADLSEIPLKNIKARCKNLPESNLWQIDFFEIEQSFDLIVEQTFFCSLHPSLRNRYAEKVHELLNPGGKLIGVLFDDKLFTDHPPYGGTINEYKTYFKSLYYFKCFESCYNSIKPRAGRELFINLVKI